MITTEVKLPIKSVKTNMVLARDVLAETGIILMAENTMLNDRNIMKLKVYDIASVYVKKTEEAEYEDPIEVKPQNEPVKVSDTPEFKQFEKVYQKNYNETKDILLSVGKGHTVDVSTLYNITKTIMHSLRSKSDLFSYLGHLHQTDEHTYTHSINVSLLCNLFGYWLGYQPYEIVNLTTAGMLHDIGKVVIDPELLYKPGKLTKDEYDEIRKHTVYGYKILENQELDDEIKKAALMHHEKINGTGYPNGIKNDDITDFAKIVAIMDIYDAMTSKRSYREKICPFDVLKTFEQESYGELDIQYVMSFLQNIAYTYIGSWVQLSNGMEGEIVFINANHLSTPIVRVDNTFYDLTLRKDLTISSML